MDEEKKAAELTDDELDQIQGAGDPLAFPNVGSGSSSTKGVKSTGSLAGSKSQATTGDEAGSTKSVVSAATQGSTGTATGGGQVLLEGKNTLRGGDPPVGG
ncbi:MAG: hypothetical protein AAGD23_08305 [Pseudomonadota bacterium]